jgi:hypothetical protein
LALTPRIKKRKHKLLIEVLDDIPSSEEHYVHNIREELDAALGRVNLKVTWMKVYPLETKERSSLETKDE